MKGSFICKKNIRRNGGCELSYYYRKNLRYSKNENNYTQILEILILFETNIVKDFSNL